MTNQYIDAAIRELEILAAKPISTQGINNLHDFHRHLTRLAESFTVLESVISDAPNQGGLNSAILFSKRCWEIADLINDAIKLHDQCYIDEMVGDAKKAAYNKEK